MTGSRRAAVREVRRTNPSPPSVVLCTEVLCRSVPRKQIIHKQAPPQRAAPAGGASAAAELGEPGGDQASAGRRRQHDGRQCCVEEAAHEREGNAAVARRQGVLQAVFCLHHFFFSPLPLFLFQSWGWWSASCRVFVAPRAVALPHLSYRISLSNKVVVHDLWLVLHRSQFPHHLPWQAQREIWSHAVTPRDDMIHSIVFLCIFWKKQNI